MTTLIATLGLIATFGLIWHDERTILRTCPSCKAEFFGARGKYPLWWLTHEWGQE